MKKKKQIVKDILIIGGISGILITLFALGIYSNKKEVEKHTSSICEVYQFRKEVML